MGLVVYPWKEKGGPRKEADAAVAGGSADRLLKMQASHERTSVQPPVSGLAKTGADQTRVFDALSRLHLASDLIDQAGRGLAPFVPGACSDALLELSLELGRIEAKLGQRAQAEAAMRSGSQRKATD